MGGSTMIKREELLELITWHGTMRRLAWEQVVEAKDNHSREVHLKRFNKHGETIDVLTSILRFASSVEEALRS
jgi:hypothetical protein